MPFLQQFSLGDLCLCSSKHPAPYGKQGFRSSFVSSFHTASLGSHFEAFDLLCVVLEESPEGWKSWTDLLEWKVWVWSTPLCVRFWFLCQNSPRSAEIHPFFPSDGYSLPKVLINNRVEGRLFCWGTQFGCHLLIWWLINLSNKGVITLLPSRSCVQPFFVDPCMTFSFHFHFSFQNLIAALAFLFYCIGKWVWIWLIFNSRIN